MLACVFACAVLQGTGGIYHKPGKSEALKPGSMLGNLLHVVPELRSFASLDLKVAFNLGEMGSTSGGEGGHAAAVPCGRGKGDWCCKDGGMPADKTRPVPAPCFCFHVQIAATWAPSSGCRWGPLPRAAAL